MTSVESSAVQFGRTRIEYGVRRSPRRRTVSVSVDPRLGVLITAPADVSISRLDTVVHRKAAGRLRRRFVSTHLRSSDAANEQASDADAALRTLRGTNGLRF